MSKATLTIAIEGLADIQRALGGIVNASRRANETIAQDTKKKLKEETESIQEKTRKKVQAVQKEESIERRSKELRLNMEKKLNQEMAKLIFSGALTEKQVADKRLEIAKRLTDELGKQERKRTEAAKKEADSQIKWLERARNYVGRIDPSGRAQRFLDGSSRAGRFASQGAAIVGQGLSHAATAFQNFGDATMNARAHYAPRQESVRQALNQVGINDYSSYVSRIDQWARENGQEGNMVAAALSSGQTNTNFLQAKDGRSTEDRFQTFLDRARIAVGSSQSIAEVTRLGGVLENNGYNAEDTNRLLLSLTGIARSGSVELGNVTQEGLGPILQAVTAEMSRNPNAVGAERQQLQSEAFTRAFALTQVGAARGLNTRDVLNGFTKFSSTLMSDRVQSNLWTNVRNSMSEERFREVNRQYFEEFKDPRGNTRHRLRSRTSLGSMSDLFAIYNGDTTALNNAVFGGGHGNPQSMSSQIRRTLGTMGQKDQGGRNGIDVMNSLIRQGSEYSQADVEAGRTSYLTTHTAELNRLQEDNTRNLMANTEALKHFGEVERFKAQNPILNQLVDTFGPLSGLMKSAAVYGMGATESAANAGGRNVNSARNQVGFGMEGFGATGGAAVYAGQRIVDYIRQNPLQAVIGAYDTQLAIQRQTTQSNSMPATPSQ